MSAALRNVTDSGLARLVADKCYAITERGSFVQGITVEGGNVCIRYIEHVTGESAVAVVAAITPRTFELLNPRRDVVAPANYARFRLAAVDVDEAAVGVCNKHLLRSIGNVLQIAAAAPQGLRTAKSTRG